MADEIKHGSTTVVDSSAEITDAALPDVGSTGATATSETQGLISITTDAKGRVTAKSTSAKKLSSIEIADADASGNTEAFSHVTGQRIYVSTSAPNSDSIGNNGDIWYQTLT